MERKEKMEMEEISLCLHFLILSPFPHSLPITSQPGCQAAAGCDSLELVNVKGCFSF